MILRLIYTLLVGVFLAIFVGVGISAFYEAPKYPDMPAVLKYCTAEVKNAPQYIEFRKQAEEFDKLEKGYFQEDKLYNRNVSIIAISFAILLVIASLTLFKKILLIADGILLGGVFTLIYSVMRGFGSENLKFEFLVVSIGLTTTLVLGYIKFIKSSKKTSTGKN